MLEPFQLPFVQRGLIEVLILAIPAGILGTWIVLRGLAFFSHAVGTASFPGLVLADGLGFAAPLGAFGAAMLFAGGTAGLRGRRSGTDAVVALVLVGCLAAGVILASDVFGSGSNIETLLFGSLLLVDGGDIALAGGVAAATVAASLLIGQHWLRSGFDPTTPAGSGPDARVFDAVLIVLVALASVAALTVVGALLVTALFVVPAITARLLTERLRSWQLLSVGLVALEGTVGLWLSVETNAPPGATIACVAGATFLLALAGRALTRVPRAAAVAAALGALALIGAGCGGGSGDGDGGEKLTVVATTTQVADFARDVGGEEVEVNQLLQPNSDPHDYEPRPSDVQAVAGADVVFASGDGLDEWIEEVVSDSGTDAEVVDLGVVAPVHLPGEGDEEEHHDSEYDPHWWHDPRNAIAAVREIERTLIAADPTRKADFERNANAYVEQLRALQAGIAACIETIPPAQRKLVTDHDAFDYFAARYGLEVVGAVIPSQTTQAQPSAKDLSELAETIESEGVEAVYPRELPEPQGGAGDRQPDRRLCRVHAVRRHAWAGGLRRRHLHRDGGGKRGFRGPRAHRRGSRVPGESLIEAEGLAAGYNGQAAISGVAFALRAGERMALLGPNGGGKTTLLRAILGELDPLAGTLRVAARCATVPQTERSQLDYPVSALEVAAMGALSRLPWWRRPGRREREAAERALEQVGLADLAHKTFGKLSGGQRQRVLIARSLVQDARVLLLDEPFSGLDRPASELLEGLIAALAAEGRGVMIATHDLEQARRWDTVLCLNRAQVACGPPQEVLGLDVIEETYGGAIVQLPGAEGRALLPPHHH